jgi:hypothetical protein
VIASFDKAVHQKDLGTMAECAQVMTQFERGDVALMQVGHTAHELHTHILSFPHAWAIGDKSAVQSHAAGLICVFLPTSASE